MVMTESLPELVRRQLAQAQALKLYTLVDASGHPELPAKLWELESEPKCEPLLLGLVEDFQTVRAGPWLVEVSVSSAWTRWFAQAITRHAAGYLLASEQALQAVAHWLRSRLVAELPNERHGQFRVYDPRILQAYWDTATKAEQSRLLGPIQFVWGWDRLSAARFELQQPGRPPLTDDVEVVRLEHAQLEAMTRRNEPYRMLQHLLTQYPQAVEKHSQETLLVELHRDLLPKADQLRLHDSSSRCLFILLSLNQPSLLKGWTFEERPWEAQSQTFAQWFEIQASTGGLDNWKQPPKQLS